MAEENISRQLQMTVYASLFAALTAAGAYLSIPVGPVPINLQSLFVLLAGLLLGRRWGAAGIGVYLLAGAIGFPVFAGGTGGIGRIIGPTGGYLIGFFFAVYIIGLISEIKRSTAMDLMAMISGTLIIYVFGLAWLMVVTNMNLTKALIAGLFPFLPGDGLKIAVALFLARTIRPVIMQD
jgi:biotin transport system substrate-specific component